MELDPPAATSTEANDHLAREARDAAILTVDGNTPAYNIFDGHLTQLEALLSLAFASEKLRMGDTPRSEFFLQSRIDRIENDYSGPWHIEVRPAMLQWQLVMHVTAVEVYLKEVLTSLALFDPKLMFGRDSKQEWSYSDIREASDRDTVLREFCYRWARSMVDGAGGPYKWVRWLAGIGVPPLSDVDVATLEGVWGLRHLQVHSGGRLTPEFVRNHRMLAEKLYNEGLSLDDLLEWRDVIHRFVEGIEKAVTGRLRAQLSDEIAAGQERTSQYMLGTLQKHHDERLAQLGEEELHRRADALMREAYERFWRMGYTARGELPVYPGDGWRDELTASNEPDGVV
jgi:hypothetical protein